ncbi:MAG: mobile mystery protein A [Bacteroidota bacterium]
METNKLIQEQLDNKIIKLSGTEQIIIPPAGWIHSIRQGINMSLKQLGQKLSITPQSVREIEEREKRGTISIKVLRQVALALNMHFVYGFVPKDQTLNKMVERRAAELAREIVERTSVQMSLEDQKVSKKRLQNAVSEKAEELKRQMPKMLWD